MMRPFPFIRLMRVMGVADDGVSDAELLVYLRQLRLSDGGTAFLRIMKGFEPTRAKQELYVGAVTSVGRRQVVWGEYDPALRLDTIGRQTAAAAVADLHVLPARHFVQEERGPELAALIARQASTAHW